MDSNKISFSKIAAVVVAIWLSFFVLGTMFFSKVEQLGQFGDMFGSVNVLFTGLALAALVYTIILQKEQNSLQGKQLEAQRKELQLQRQELKLQRKEMAASRAELANQTRGQRSLLIVSIAELKMKVKEARIASIEARARGLGAGSQEGISKEIEQIAESMADLVKMTADDIVKFDAESN